MAEADIPASDGNLIAALPDTIGSIVGNALGRAGAKALAEAKSGGSLKQENLLAGTPYEGGRVSNSNSSNLSYKSGIPQNGIEAPLPADELSDDIVVTPRREPLLRLANFQSINAGPKLGAASPVVIDKYMGGAHAVIFGGDSLLIPIIRKSGQTFTDTSLMYENKMGLDAVINGPLFNSDNRGFLGIVDPSDVTAQGLVIAGGHVFEGRSSPDTFFVAQSKDAEGQITTLFGQGDPPAGSISAFGGGKPLIIDGLRYGPINLYVSGVSGPLIGDPGKYSGSLTQRSNAGIGSFIDKYESSGDYSAGKTVLAYSSKGNIFAVVVQQDGARNGISISSITDRLQRSGFDNALLFDGSTSSTLVRGGTVMIQPSYYKNNVIEVGIGIKLR